MMPRLLCLPLAVAALSLADLAPVNAEPDLEKRSEKAMKNAHASLDRARQAMKEGDVSAEAAALTEVRESVELCKLSLDQSGKNPRRSPKYFKRAEMDLRKLIRRLDSFLLELSVYDRGPVDQLIARCHAIHEELIAGIMGKKGK